MKGKTVFSLIIAALVTVIYLSLTAHAEIIYQEFANQTVDNILYNHYNATDGNYSTSARSSSNEQQLLQNYSIPLGYNLLYWQFLISNGSLYIHNFSINSADFNVSGKFITNVTSSIEGGTIDIIWAKVWNKTLGGWQQIWYQSGNANWYEDGVFYSSDVSQTVSFVPPTPSDGGSNNTQVAINVTCSLENVTLWFDANTNPITKVIDNASSPANYTTNVSVGATYYYKASCDMGKTNSSIRRWTFDAIEPNITFNPTNFFTALNLSNQNQYGNIIKTNITIEDNSDLFAFQINITRNGIVYFNFTNITLTGNTVFTYNNTINISTWGFGEYNITVVAEDTHTAHNIRDWIVNKDNKRLDFTTEQNNKVIVKSDLDADITATKERDRYTFNYKFKKDLFGNVNKKKVFTVECDNDLVYLPDSKYTAHFICYDSSDLKKGGNWIDFVGNYDKPKIEKKTKFFGGEYYEVTFNNDLEEMRFSSLGGLNVRVETYKWYRGQYNLIASDGLARQNIPFYFNLSKHTTQTNIEADLYYNGVAYANVTKTTASDYVLFHQVIQAPDLTLSVQNYSFTWNYTITQNTVVYNSSVNSYNTISSFGLDDCSNRFNLTSNATAYNITFFNENLNQVYVDYKTTILYWQNVSIANFNYSTSKTNINFTQICVYPSTANLSGNQQIEYTYYGTIFSYFMNNADYNNNTRILHLYTNNGTSQVLFSVLDFDGNPKVNYRIQILKYDVGTGAYTTTEIIQTDTYGHAIGNIVLNNAFYNFLIYDTTNTLVHSAAGIRLTTTTYTFTISASQDEYYANLDTTLGLYHTTYFNNETDNFVFTWSDPTGQMHLACLRIEALNWTGAYMLHDNCTASAAGTIVYHINNPQNETTYLAKSYLRYGYIFPLDSVSHVYNNIRSFFQQSPFNSLFIAIILLMVGILIGLPNPVMSMIYFLSALIISSFLGLYNIALPMLGGLILFGIIIIFIGGKQQ